MLVNTCSSDLLSRFFVWTRCLAAVLHSCTVWKAHVYSMNIIEWHEQEKLTCSSDRHARFSKQICLLADVSLFCSCCLLTGFWRANLWAFASRWHLLSSELVDWDVARDPKHHCSLCHWFLYLFFAWRVDWAEEILFLLGGIFENITNVNIDVIVLPWQPDVNGIAFSIARNNASCAM